eukprot:GFUD01068355.1.p1 GENE.GFUD01068355.1~~GFUD01068355.1.p1  ORF type:complete len:158 (-),score=44.54 GFUD01068355.1:32-505(-)
MKVQRILTILPYCALYTRLTTIYTTLVIFMMGCTKCLSRNMLEGIMRLPCTALVNWEEIVEEISCSNIIQRDNIMFAKKLSKNLVALAKEKDANAKNEKLWSERARRKVLYSILDEWVKVSTKKTTVKNLLSALSLPGWFDVKLRVEKLLEKNCLPS